MIGILVFLVAVTVLLRVTGPDRPRTCHWHDWAPKDNYLICRVCRHRWGRN